MTAQLPLSGCQRRLALLWVSAALALFLVLIAQSILGKYGASSERAWAWFLPTILPTVSLIVGAVISGAKNALAGETVDRFAYRVSFGLSVFYLVLVATVPLVQPLTSRTPLELMELSNLWLGPVQGLVALSLGAYFVSGRQSG